VNPTDIERPITLADLVEAETFKDVCRNFYDLFGVSMRLYDAQGGLIAEQAEDSSVCRAMQEFSSGRTLCHKTRASVVKTIPSEDNPVTVDCASGCRYEILPLVYNGDHLGRLVFGPYLPSERESISIEPFQKDPSFDPRTFLPAFGSMRRLSKTAVEQIQRALSALLQVVIFNGHRTFLTSRMHIAAIREAYQELSNKNKQIEEANERLKEFDRLRSAFLATVSHELRTPLTSIIGYSEMLFEGITGDLSGDQKQAVNTIRTKGEELLRLISSLLDFSQTETGHLEINRKLIHPKEITETAVRRVEELAKRRGILIHTKEESGLPRIHVDPDRLSTALFHVVENAIKFSHPGGEVFVEARLAPASVADVPEDGMGFVLLASPDMVEFRVIDKGPGIPEENREKIFMPFQQLDPSSTREHGGAGLGLTIVQQFVEAHGGRITVGGKVGEGSVFTMRIPVSKTYA